MAVEIPRYEALTPLGGPRVRLRFHGPFEGHEVLWDATFMTLAHYRASAAEYAHAEDNLIDIGGENEGMQALTVVLDVAAFDVPTVLKTIIMVRQYRRLRRGHMTFATANVSD